MRSLAIDRSAVVDWYLSNRARSRAIFDLIDPAAYYSRPIALRNPIVFYEGHLPAFSVLSFLRRGLGHPPIDERLEKLFERGIDPDSADSAVPRSGAATKWPSRDEVLAFGARADEAIVRALEAEDFIEDRPAMQRGQALYTALEHEAMHQETLLYMWHRLPYEQKAGPGRPAPDLPTEGGRYATDLWVPPSGGRTVRIPAGVATLGADRDRIPFGWDNEFDEHRVGVSAFDIDVNNVTNAEFMEFVEAGGYRARELWSADHWAWLQEVGLTHPNFWVLSTRATRDARSGPVPSTRTSSSARKSFSTSEVRSCTSTDSCSKVTTAARSFLGRSTRRQRWFETVVENIEDLRAFKHFVGASDVIRVRVGSDEVIDLLHLVTLQRLEDNFSFAGVAGVNQDSRTGGRNN
jgi:formylglycine-generating enzyme required for sulfatase activity